MGPGLGARSLGLTDRTVGRIALKAYKAKLASKLEWARLERAEEVPGEALEQVRELEEQVQRLSERMDFTEKLLGDGRREAS